MVQDSYFKPLFPQFMTKYLNILIKEKDIQLMKIASPEMKKSQIQYSIHIV